VQHQRRGTEGSRQEEIKKKKKEEEEEGRGGRRVVKQGNIIHTMKGRE